MTPSRLAALAMPAARQPGILLQAWLVENSTHGISVRRLGQGRAGELRLTRFLHSDAVTV